MPGDPEIAVTDPDIFSGLAVVEVASGIAGRLVGVLLAELGAAVVAVEDPRVPADDGRETAYYRRGKRVERLDLAAEAGHERMVDLARSADVMIVDGTADETTALGLNYESLSAASPGLTYLALPPFGERGPLADSPGGEGPLAAYGGVMAEQASEDGTPTLVQTPVVGTSTGLIAFGALVAALVHGRRVGGKGQQVVVPQVAGALAVQAHSFVRADGGGSAGPDAWWRRHPLGPHPAFSFHHGSDGWFALAVLHPRFFQRLCVAVGHPEWFDDPRFEGTPLVDKAPEVDDWLFAELAHAFRARPRDEWLEILGRADIPSGPVLSRAECIADEQVAAAGLRAEVDDVALGATVQYGLPIRFSRTPGRVAEGGRAATRGDAGGEPAGGTPATAGGPLAGIRVVDLGNYIAGTYGGSLLADMGADVIKVESLEGDPFRHSGADFLAYNRGKRSLAIDLKTAAGREALLRLAAEADVFIENMRPGVADRLGAGYDHLAALNPRLVYVSVSAFGSTGPRSGQPGFDLLLQAFSGAPLAQAGPEGHPVYHTAAFADYGAALLAMCGAVAGLYEREASGRGQHAETSLLAGAMLMQAGEYTQVAGGGPAAAESVAPLAGRLVRASDGWIYIDKPSAAGDRDVPDLENDAVGAGRIAGSRSTVDWLRLLAAAGVRAVPVHSPRELLFDRHLRANGLVDERDDRNWGHVVQGGLLARFSGTPTSVRRLSPLLGEHTTEILESAGYGAAEVENLLASGVVRVPGSPATVAVAL